MRHPLLSESDRNATNTWKDSSIRLLLVMMTGSSELRQLRAPSSMIRMRIHEYRAQLTSACTRKSEWSKPADVMFSSDLMMRSSSLKCSSAQVMLYSACTQIGSRL